MNISKEDAQASLITVQNIKSQTQKAIASSYANSSLILWGSLWIAAFITTHFYGAYAFYIFMAMSITGGIGTAMIFKVFNSKAPIKETSKYKMRGRIIALWIFLFIYIVIWLSLLSPFNGIQCNAFICTAAMFANIVIGLWFKNSFMIILGIAVTVATLIGFYLLRDYYCLWMAFVGGGAMLGTGIYIRLLSIKMNR